MRKRFITFFVASALLWPAVPAAMAHGDDDDESARVTQSSDESTDSDDADELENETQDDKNRRDERISKAKAAFKVRLEAAEKTRLQNRCKASQGRLSSVSGRFKGIQTSRSKVHENLLNRLNNLVTKLKVNNVDTTQLEANVAELKTKMDTFNTDLETYKQSITDLKAIDCQADPDGFKAALEQARANLQKVREDAKAVHTYLKETIKPLLKSIREQLEGSEDTDETETETEAENENEEGEQ